MPKATRAYRWGEDGLGGITDNHNLLCFALALWNGQDPILKERMFGLTNPEGNHGEDVKKYYFYLDSTPTHSYMKYLYKYPQAEFPYGDLVETNRNRDRYELEYEEDGFFYDVLRLPGGNSTRLKVRSLVGLLSLMAVSVFPGEAFEKLPNLKAEIEEFTMRHPELLHDIHLPTTPGVQNRLKLSILNEDKLRRVLARMLDESEFLRDYGIRSLSRHHLEHPYYFHHDGQEHKVGYVPGDSTSGMFGGNSNWRGPIWMPMNLLSIRGLLQYYTYYGESFTVEYPTGSGEYLSLYDVTECIAERIVSIFLKDGSGRRPIYGGAEKFQTDPHWRDLILFYEYFHGDNGAGIGASHQTGWTACVARLLQGLGFLTKAMLLETPTPGELNKYGFQRREK